MEPRPYRLLLLFHIPVFPLPQGRLKAQLGHCGRKTKLYLSAKRQAPDGFLGFWGWGEREKRDSASLLFAELDEILIREASAQVVSQCE